MHWSVPGKVSGWGWCLISLVLFNCQTVRPGEQQQPIPGAFQGWADDNSNGVLDMQEVERLVIAVEALVAGPHPAVTPVDLFFDTDHDGNITSQELDSARRFLFGEQFLKLSSVNPRFSFSIDFTTLGEVDDEDIEYIMEFLFMDIKQRWPRSIKNTADEKLDHNKDGFVDELEIDNYVRYLYLAASLAPFAPGLEEVES